MRWPAGGGWCAGAGDHRRGADFCAGQDLNDRAVAPGRAVDLGESVEKNMRPLVKTIRALPIPVIAAVNGVAAGAGCSFALACDLVIASERRRLPATVLQAGRLIPDTGGSYFLPASRRYTSAMGLAMLGDKDSHTAGGGAQVDLGCMADDAFAAHTSTRCAAQWWPPGRRLATPAPNRRYAGEQHVRRPLALEGARMRECGSPGTIARGVAAFKESGRPRGGDRFWGRSPIQSGLSTRFGLMLTSWLSCARPNKMDVFMKKLTTRRKTAGWVGFVVQLR